MQQEVLVLAGSACDLQRCVGTRPAAAPGRVLCLLQGSGRLTDL